MVEDAYIAEFKQLYKERYGIELSDVEASFRANHLLNLYRAVLGPDPKDAAGENGTEQNTRHES